MRLLDLFCGAIDAQKNICYGRPKYIGGLPCKRSPVKIAVKFLNHSEERGNFAQFHVPIGLLGRQKKLALAVNAADLLNLEVRLMQIGDTARQHVQKKVLQKALWPFTNTTLDTAMRLIKSASLKIQGCGGKRLATNGRSPSVYLAESV
jgi:hypothetical protein